MRRNVQLYLGEHGREGVHSPGGHPGILSRQVRGRTEVCLYRRARRTVDVRACQGQVLEHHFNLVLLFGIKMSRESVLKNPLFYTGTKSSFAKRNATSEGSKSSSTTRRNKNASRGPRNSRERLRKMPRNSRERPRKMPRNSRERPRKMPRNSKVIQTIGPKVLFLLTLFSMFYILNLYLDFYDIEKL